MKKAVLVGRILLISLGAIIIWLGAIGIITTMEDRRMLGPAVYLEEPVVLPENEGKTVIVHGKVEMTEPAYDEELGLTLETIKAFRYDEEYDSITTEDKEIVYKWHTRGTESIVGKANMGEFRLDESVLIAFPAESERYEDFNPEEIRKYGTDWGEFHTYVLVDAYMYYPEHTSLWQGSERAGDRVSYYRWYDPSRHDEMTTVVAVQQGNSLVAHESMIPMVEDGIWSREELMKKKTGIGIIGSTLFFAAGVVPVFFGLKGIVKQKKKKNGKKQKKR